MTTQICRALELILRSGCCRKIRSRSCLRQAALAPACPSGLCVPRITVVHQRAYSLDSFSTDRSLLGSNTQQPHSERTSPSSALTHRNLSAVAVHDHRHLLFQHNYTDVGDIDEHIRRAQACKTVRHFIVSPALADVVAQHLRPDLRDAKTVIFDCNPGPGVLTKSLLNAGAQRLVSLESDKAFFHDLQELERHLDGQLQVVHCNYFKLDPIGNRTLKPPVMLSEELFTNLGISEASWTDDVPVKVVGIIPPHNERGTLLKMVYALFERLSVYRYGRVELDLFISQKEYLKLVARPGQFRHYRAFSVLWQIACDIELLHKEPRESFVTSSKLGAPTLKSTLPNDHLCLVRLRPRADLFSTGLTLSNASTLLMLVKQCMAKRTSRLIDWLNIWAPDSGSKLLSQMGMPEDILTGHVYPEEYRELFELMDKSKEFTESWLYEEILENTKRNGWI